MSRGPTWSDDEKTALRFLVKNGMGDEQIASILPGRTPHAVRSARNSMGILARRRIEVENPIKKIVAPASEPNRANGLPDVGEQLFTISDKLTVITSQQRDVINSINDLFREADAISGLLSGIINIQQEQLDIFRRLANVKGKTADAPKEP